MTAGLHRCPGFAATVKWIQRVSVVMSGIARRSMGRREVPELVPRATAGSRRCVWCRENEGLRVPPRSRLRWSLRARPYRQIVLLSPWLAPFTCSSAFVASTARTQPTTSWKRAGRSMVTRQTHPSTETAEFRTYGDRASMRRARRASALDWPRIRNIFVVSCFN
jgi:hypothetical protein